MSFISNGYAIIKRKFKTGYNMNMFNAIGFAFIFVCL